jgi:hypothetical protein
MPLKSSTFYLINALACFLLGITIFAVTAHILGTHKAIGLPGGALGGSLAMTMPYITSQRRWALLFAPLAALAGHFFVVLCVRL